MTRDEFAPVVRLLVNCYGASRFTPDALSDWYDLLKDLPGPRVLEAAKEVCKTTDFPSVNAIRSRIPHTVDSGFYQKAEEDLFAIRAAISRHLLNRKHPDAIGAALKMADDEARDFYRDKVRPYGSN